MTALLEPCRSRSQIGGKLACKRQTGSPSLGNVRVRDDDSPQKREALAARYGLRSIIEF